MAYSDRELPPPDWDSEEPYRKEWIMKEKKKNGRPQKYVFWKDWEAWQLKEWLPFKLNDFAHLKNDVKWLKIIGVGIFLAVVGKLIVDFFWG